MFFDLIFIFVVFIGLIVFAMYFLGKKIYKFLNKKFPLSKNPSITVPKLPLCCIILSTVFWVVKLFSGSIQSIVHMFILYILLFIHGFFFLRINGIFLLNSKKTKNKILKVEVWLSLLTYLLSYLFMATELPLDKNGRGYALIFLVKLYSPEVIDASSMVSLCFLAINIFILVVQIIDYRIFQSTFEYSESEYSEPKYSKPEYSKPKHTDPEDEWYQQF